MLDGSQPHGAFRMAERFSRDPRRDCRIGHPPRCRQARLRYGDPVSASRGLEKVSRCQGDDRRITGEPPRGRPVDRPCTPIRRANDRRLDQSRSDRASIRAVFHVQARDRPDIAALRCSFGLILRVVADRTQRAPADRPIVGECNQSRRVSRFDNQSHLPPILRLVGLCAPGATRGHIHQHALIPAAVPNRLHSWGQFSAVTGTVSRLPA